MNWGSPEFVLLLVMVCTAGWVVTTWIRAKHGYPLEGEWGGVVHKTDDRKAEMISAENEKLKGMVVRLEDRLSVLERIATDQPSQLSAEIERLR